MYLYSIVLEATYRGSVKGHGIGSCYLVIDLPFFLCQKPTYYNNKLCNWPDLEGGLLTAADCSPLVFSPVEVGSCLTELVTSCDLQDLMSSAPTELISLFESRHGHYTTQTNTKPPTHLRTNLLQSFVGHLLED